MGVSELLQQALDVISKAQPKKEGPVWMVGEQLKDILRAAPELAQIVIEDFQAGTPLEDCEKKINDYARKHGGCCIPTAADKIIREHFGLTGAAPQTPAASSAKRENAEDDFAALWG